MPTKKKTWFAILGLLAWQPMTGYQLKKFVEIALSYFWSESYGQLYPTLGRLVDEGLATRRPQAQPGRRARTVFAITALGRRELAKWFTEPSELPRIRNEFQLKFFLTSRRSRAEGIRLLEEYRAQLAERQDLYLHSERVLQQAVVDRAFPEEIASVLDEAPPDSDEFLVFYLTLRHGLSTLNARIAWCDEAIAILRDGRPLAPLTKT